MFIKGIPYSVGMKEIIAKVLNGLNEIELSQGEPYDFSIAIYKKGETYNREALQNILKFANIVDFEFMKHGVPVITFVLKAEAVKVFYEVVEEQTGISSG